MQEAMQGISSKGYSKLPLQQCETFHMRINAIITNPEQSPWQNKHNCAVTEQAKIANAPQEAAS